MEVRRLDDERVAVPAAARVAEVLTNRRRHVRAAVERNDARVVDLLHLNDDVVLRLEDSVHAHVRGEQIRNAVGDAAIGQREIAGAARTRRLRGGRPRAVDGLRRQRRQLAVGRILDQRRAVLEVAIGHPVLTVRAGHEGLARATCRRAGRGTAQSPNTASASGPKISAARASQRGHLVVGEPRLVGKLRRPFERRGAVVLPRALQVGLTVR